MVFQAHAGLVLIPTLTPGDIVVMDNSPAHKGAPIRVLFEAAGPHLLYLPPYSPDFNPIANALSKLKSILRKAAARTVAGLWATSGEAIAPSTPEDCANDFTATGN